MNDYELFSQNDSRLINYLIKFCIIVKRIAVKLRKEKVRSIFNISVTEKSESVQVSPIKSKPNNYSIGGIISPNQLLDVSKAKYPHILPDQISKQIKISVAVRGNLSKNYMQIYFIFR